VFVADQPHFIVSGTGPQPTPVLLLPLHGRHPETSIEAC